MYVVKIFRFSHLRLKIIIQITFKIGINCLNQHLNQNILLNVILLVKINNVNKREVLKSPYSGINSDLLNKYPVVNTWEILKSKAMSCPVTCFRCLNRHQLIAFIDTYFLHKLLEMRILMLKSFLSCNIIDYALIKALRVNARNLYLLSRTVYLNNAQYFAIFTMWG